GGGNTLSLWRMPRCLLAQERAVPVGFAARRARAARRTSVVRRRPRPSAFVRPPAGIDRPANEPGLGMRADVLGTRNVVPSLRFALGLPGPGSLVALSAVRRASSRG